jgi:hypothetical protein
MRNEKPDALREVIKVELTAEEQEKAIRMKREGDQVGKWLRHHRIEVRYTRHPEGRLKIEKTDADDHRFVLVRGSMPEYQIVGWMKGKEGKRPEWLDNPDEHEEARGMIANRGGPVNANLRSSDIDAAGAEMAVAKYLGYLMQQQQAPQPQPGTQGA